MVSDKSVQIPLNDCEYTRATFNPVCSTDINPDIANFHVLDDIHLYFNDNGNFKAYNKIFNLLN